MTAIQEETHKRAQAEAERIRFRDQKSGEKNEKRTQGRGQRHPILDPVTRLGSAIVRLKNRVEGWDENTDLCTIGRQPNLLRLTDEMTLATLRSVCRLYGGAKTFGFGPEEIGNKSLRSGAAMSLVLSKKNHTTFKIQILGRWKSEAFMRYIRPQVLELTSDLAEDMLGEDTMTDLNTTTKAAAQDDFKLNF